MKAYTVYRIDHLRHVKEPIGMVVERRREDRGNNFESLLKLARKLFFPSPDSHITISLE